MQDYHFCTEVVEVKVMVHLNVQLSTHKATIPLVESG